MTDRSVRAIAFDVDGTLVRENFWTALNRLGGLSEADDIRLMELYIEGKLLYHDWMAEIVRFYRVNPPREAEVRQVLSTYAFAPGAAEVVEALRGYPIALISSNIDSYVIDVAAKLGITHAYGYITLEYANGLFSNIGFTSPGNELAAKVEALEDFAKKTGVGVRDIAFVGDSRNDLDAFVATGRGVLIGEGNEELQRAAWRRVSTLKEIPAVLAIANRTV